MMTENKPPIDQISRWVKHSVTIKLCTIGILVLILLVPSSMIRSIIREREQTRINTENEVSAMWAGKQTLTGPIIQVPLIYECQRKIKKEGTEGVKIERYDVEKILTILPKQLDVQGGVEPEKLRRGIYEIIVYNSKLIVKGDFDLKVKYDRTNLKKVKWEDAVMTIGISDLKGIQDQISLKLDDQSYHVQPGVPYSLVNSGVSVPIPNLRTSLDKTLDFELQLDLKGSQNLSFIPVGGTTDIQLRSTWNTPSFNGSFLPKNRKIDDKGFTSQWKVLELNRNFPQSWVGVGNYDFSSSAFGVDLIIPIDDYQKSMRSAKYAVMTLALTFLVFFLIEILNKRKIHPFQYTLVGLGICLFYILLVSISEHSNFNIAYLISTIATVAMISLYSLTVFKKPKLSLMLTAVLAGIYAFVFVTLQLADFALLLGSIGLMVILGLTMFFTRNINWYRVGVSTQ